MRRLGFWETERGGWRRLVWGILWVGGGDKSGDFAREGEREGGGLRISLQDEGIFSFALCMSFLVKGLEVGEVEEIIVHNVCTSVLIIRIYLGSALMN